MCTLLFSRKSLQLLAKRNEFQLSTVVATPSSCCSLEILIDIEITQSQVNPSNIIYIRI